MKINTVVFTIKLVSFNKYAIIISLDMKSQI